MTDGACWVESTDELPLTTDEWLDGTVGPKYVSVPFWDRDCALWVEGWARRRGFVSRRRGWDGNPNDWYVCEVRVTRDQLVDFCGYLKTSARVSQFNNGGIEAFQALVAKFLDPTRTYLLAGDTF